MPRTFREPCGLDARAPPTFATPGRRRRGFGLRKFVAMGIGANDAGRMAIQLETADVVA